MKFFKTLFSILFLLSCFGLILWIFWKQEAQFSLPTPKPVALEQMPIGHSIDSTIIGSQNKFLFVHYYNKDCPCSRFNIKEFKSMVYNYQQDIEFVAVVQSADEGLDAAQHFKEKFDLPIRVIHDKKGEIAAELGIYSTPQAVIIKNNQLYYRGNYNRARFCTSKNTKFAELAIKALLDNKEAPVMPEQALIAYGCELPSNEKEATIDIFNF